MALPDSRGITGHLIAGKYRLTRCIGAGGMGSVWRAEHATLGAPVAIKLVDPKLLDRPDIDAAEVLARFVREARAAAAIRSPHVVQIFDHGVDGAIPWMALELLEGESLERRLERLRVLPREQTARIITHVARALIRAHEAGIVHRDLKPSNIFLVRNDDEEVTKILDFGLVKMRAAPLNSGHSDFTGARVIGTPFYMSPEQIQGKKLDYRTDLWAVAVITFECVVGRLPFRSEAMTQLLLEICVDPIPIPSKLAPVPEGFDAWFAKAAHRDPSQRFQSAREMAQSLRSVLVPVDSSGAMAMMRWADADSTLNDGVLRLPPPDSDNDEAPTRVMGEQPPEATHKTDLSISSDIRHLRSPRKLVVAGLIAFGAALGVLALVLLSGSPEESGTQGSAEATTATTASPTTSAAATTEAVDVPIAATATASVAPTSSASAPAPSVSSSANEVPRGRVGPRRDGRLGF